MTVSRARFRILIWLQGVWVFSILALALWWGSLLYKQAILLENPAFSRMIFWESVSLIVLVLFVSSFLVWLHMRETKRTEIFQHFLTGVSHDLKTPLSALRLQAELLEAELKNKQISLATPGKMLADLDRLQGQVEKTLSFARLESGIALCPETLEIKSTLEQLVASYELSDRIRIDSQLTKQWVIADPQALQIIFKNLIENCVKHSAQDKIKLLIEAKEDHQGVWVHVQDNGVGYRGSPILLGKAFLKGPHSSGTGLGLYLVKLLMEQMGGKATFLNQNGFQVKLWFQKSLSV